MMLPVDERIKSSLNDQLKLLENHFNGDFIVFNGPILSGLEKSFLTIVEDLVKDADKKDVSVKPDVPRSEH